MRIAGKRSPEEAGNFRGHLIFDTHIVEVPTFAEATFFGLLSTKHSIRNPFLLGGGVKKKSLFCMFLGKCSPSRDNLYQ